MPRSASIPLVPGALVALVLALGTLLVPHGTLVGRAAADPSTPRAASSEPELHVTRSATLTGRAALGSRLGYTRPTWDRHVDRTETQWRRDGQPVPGETGRHYLVRKGDLGHKISVRVTGYKAGYYPSYADSYGKRVGPAVSTTHAALEDSSIRPHQRARVTVQVRCSYAAAPRTGRVLILERGEVIGRATLSRTDDGRTTVRSQRLRAGDHHLKVVYVGDADTGGSKSAVLQLYVGP